MFSWLWNERTLEEIRKKNQIIQTLIPRLKIGNPYASSSVPEIPNVIHQEVNNNDGRNYRITDVWSAGRPRRVVELGVIDDNLDCIMLRLLLQFKMKYLRPQSHQQHKVSHTYLHGFINKWNKILLNVLLGLRFSLKVSFMNKKYPTPLVH